jgi:hypothetical protein
MTYAYSYKTNTIDKYESIQSDISDAYAYLDEEETEQPPVDDFDDVDDDELAKVFALSWDN